MKQSFWKKSVSLLLTLSMLLGTFPVSVFAATEKSANVISSAENFPSEIPAGAVYELSADITLNADQQIATLAGTLDGKGHTVTLNGKPLAHEVTGTIQNLGLASKEVLKKASGLSDGCGSFAENFTGGTLLNSFSTVDMKSSFDDLGGLVGQSVGGTIRNSFYAGTITGQLFGGIIGQSTDSARPSTITECYFTSGELPVSMGTCYNKAEGRFARKTLDEMKAAEFADLLNTNITETGFVWEAVPGSLPKLAAADNSIVITGPDNFPTEIPADAVYKLAADITLNKNQQIATLAGILDGQGHTVTLNGKPLAHEVTGTIQNLGLASTDVISKPAAAYADGCGSFAENFTGGTLLNSFSTVDMKSSFDDLGGLVGRSVGGTIRNSFYAGTITGQLFGGIIGQSTDSARPSTITECYFTSGELPVSQGTHYNKDEGRFARKTLDEMKTAEFADLLNANITETGFKWEAAAGNLPKLVPADGGAGPDVPSLNTKNLEAVIAEAKALKTEKYTADSWKAVADALTAAESALKNEALTQKEADAAAKTLRDAIDALVIDPSALRQEAVKLPETGVIEITSQDQIKDMTIGSTKGKFYRLSNDIVIDDPYWYGTSFAGVLEGNGHTITVQNNAPIWEELSQDAVLQNIGFLGSVSSANDVGLIAVRSSGLIVNCWSRADVSSEGMNQKIKNTGGLVGTLTTGGVIANSYVAGAVSAKGNTGSGKTGAMAAIAETGTLIKNCYWLNTTADKAAGVSSGLIVSSAAKGRGAFYSKELLDSFNANRGACGKEWTVDNDGWLHLGEAGNFNPEVGSGLVFTFDSVYGKEPVTFDSGSGLTLSLADALLPVDAGEQPRFAGTFSAPNLGCEPVFIAQYEAGGQGRHHVLVSSLGELDIQGAGSLEISVCDKDSWSGTTYEKEVTRFTVVVTNVEAEEIRLVPHGKYVTGNTVAGSGNVVVKGQVKIDGVWRQAFPTMFSFTTSGEIFGEGDGFYATAPGEITVNATGFGKTATLVMESTYVPVTYIKPFPQGLHYIHARNANSSKLGDFLDLSLADQAGRVDVRPENASYRNAWRMESSDPTVAEYIPDFLLAVLPYKAGSVTLTAVSEDPRLTAPMTGSTQLELRYLNPVKSVAVDVPAETGKLTVKENETISLPIRFEGTQPPKMAVDPVDGIEKEYTYHVSEPEMIWTFEGDGEVEITRDGNLGVLVKTPLEYCVANDKFLLTGAAAGTVTVTGTPMDQTAGAKPVTFTVEVTGGAPVKPFDVAQFVRDGKETASNLLTRNLTYAYGDEWNIYTLLRAGETLPKAELDRYYDSVAKAAAAWGNTQKPTDIARVALALTAMGRDITNVNGVDMAAMLYNHDSLRSGSNEVAWALIALDAKKTVIPADAKADRRAMLEILLSFQNEDGGFSLNAGGNSGADTTAMALQALAPYKETAAEAIQKGIDYLKTVHDKANRFDAGNCEANAQTIITLAVLDRDAVTEPGFFSARHNLMTVLNGYFVKDEGFKHDITMKVNPMATVQAMQALDAYDRFVNGKSPYWDLSKADPVDPEAAHSFISGENQTVQQGSIPDAVVLKLTGDVSKFVSLSVNGTVLDKANYTVAEDSVTISINKSYLESLAIGSYKLLVTFTDGTASTRLFVEEAPFIPDPEKSITVTFTLYGDEHHDESIVHTFKNNRSEMPVWIKTCQITVPERSTVYDVVEAALAMNNMTSYNPSGNYYSTINGLSEFDNGSNSGWMYILNGQHPGIGVGEQSVATGDEIIVHYTDDYTQEENRVPTVDPAVIAAENLIDAIGTVTTASGEQIGAARKAYDALSSIQKQQVRNYAVLTAAEKKFAELTASEADRKAAAKVEALIDSIGTVTLESENAIRDARSAYKNLTASQKALVKNYPALISAEKKLANLKNPSHEEIYKETGDSLSALVNQQAPYVGVIGGEWLVLGLVRSGRPVPVDAYYENVLKFVAAEINDKEQLHRAKSSENSRLILALTALGKDVTNVGGHNLLMGLTDMKYVTRQGINGAIWALIALDSHNYEIPANPAAREQVTREKLIAHILKAQLPDGGWALAGNASDADMTGMALQALARYYNTDAAVKAAVDKALDTLSAMQNEDGLFSSIDGVNVESSAQIVVALAALGIDPASDPRFVKDGISALDGLCSFARDGGFKHVPNGERDPMSTEQGYYALTAYFRMLNDQTALYDMSDVVIGEQPEPKPNPEVKPDPETKPEPDPDTDAPDTGDESHMSLFVVMMIISALVLVVLLVIIIRKKRSSK